MLKFVVGAFIVVLSWTLAIWLEFPLWIPTLITLLVGLVLLLIVGLAKFRERRAARDLEKALQAQAAQQAATARPDLKAELDEMQAEFQRAIAALKGVKKRGSRALYDMPWYTIIGPPGSGKSTALRNSGLQFPYLSASGGGVRGLGGTRNCDWWLTNDAVILDTAGRWTSEEEDRDEWLGFLAMVKRFRPKKPLNGVIAAVSVGDIGGAREEDVATLAKRIRERIDEVMGNLKMSLPVYVLFTKCDLIPGFVETFGDLPKQERGQVWGFTAPLSKKIGPPGEYFCKGFDELVGVLEYRALRRMGEERKISNREMVFAFPQQLLALRQNLAEFVHHLFLENVFKETPLMRGVYFTSGTQEGRPIDRVMHRMAEAFGQQQVPLPQAQVESKSYFLRDTFSNVVFKDKDVAVRSPEEISRQRRVTYITAAGIFGIAVMVSGLPALAWAKNRSFLSDTRAVIDESVGATASEVAGPLPPEALDRLRNRAMELHEHDQSGPPVTMRLGMYPGQVYEPVRDVYLHTLHRRVFGPILAHDANEMDQFARRLEALGGGRPDAAELRQHYARLKLHLLMTLPRGEHDPSPNDENDAFLVEQLSLRWAAAHEIPRHDPRRETIRQSVEFYVQRMRRQEELFFPRRDATVGAIRGVFAAVGGFDMAVEGIIEEIRPLGYDLILGQLVGRGVNMLQATERVRGAFTRRAWEERVRNMLETDAVRFFGEHWVLGEEPPDSEREAERIRAERVAGLRSYYLERYATEWRTFINSIEVRVPRDDEQLVLLLSQLTSGDPQRLTELVRQIDYNLTLPEPASGPGVNLGAAGDNAAREARRRAERSLSKRLGGGRTGDLLDQAEGGIRQRVGGGMDDPDLMTPQRVRSRFDGFIAFAPAPAREVPDGQRAQTTPATMYEEQLEFLLDAIRLRVEGSDVGNYAERQRRAREVTERIISELDRDWRDRFRSLLMPPITGVVPEGGGAAPTQPTRRPR